MQTGQEVVAELSGRTGLVKELQCRYLPEQTGKKPSIKCVFRTGLAMGDPPGQILRRAGSLAFTFAMFIAIDWFWPEK